MDFSASEWSFLVTILLSLYLSLILSLLIGFLSLLVLPDPEPVALSGRLLDSPKSQIFIWQSWLMRIFEGFKSLWIMFEEQICFMAHKILYSMVLTWSYESYAPLMTLDKSLAWNSMMMKRSSISSDKIVSRTFGTNALWSPLRIYISLIILTIL